MNPNLLEPRAAAAPWAKPRFACSWRGARLLAISTLLALVAWEAVHVLVGLNFYTLIPGKVYRGAQPNAADLAWMQQRFGIRTVLNLRGFSPTVDTYRAETVDCQRLGLGMADIGFSAGRLPNAGELKNLVEFLDGAEYPIYVHCRRGADRTGLVAVIIMLLQPDSTVAAARKHMTPRYGHIPIGRPANLDRFFDLYDQWLADRGHVHDPALFRRWLTREYEGGWLQYRMESVRPLQAAVKTLRPAGFVVRTRNVGPRAWQIKSHGAAGIHMTYRVFDELGRVLDVGYGAFQEATIAPGEVLESTVVVSGLPWAGKYSVVFDLIETHHATFLQAGAEPLEEEFEVRE